ncbi:MAG: rhomboid family intramembrane serine protease [Planctomycetes bacterium]|nr:rhomboid family intramembrane serine protease [Planctomycetota bacterium]
MILPYAVDVPLDRRPWMNGALIALTIGVSVACFVQPDLVNALALGRPDVPAPLQQIAPLLEGTPGFDKFPARFEPHSYVSHGFVHAGFLHLVGNMVFLFVFGNAVNYKLGHIGYLVTYISLMCIAAGVHVVARGTPAVGASGAIFGVIGVFVVCFPLNRVHCAYFAFYRLHDHVGWFEVSSIWIVASWVVCDVLTMFFDLAGNVAVEAHLGGFAAGFVAGLLLVAAKIVRPGESERTLLDLLWHSAR